MTLKEKCEEIVGYYGINHQLKKLSEEVFELIEAILCDYDKNTITGEFADVMVLMNQIAIFYQLDKREIDAYKDYKINRQMKRMEEEQKEL